MAGDARLADTYGSVRRRIAALVGDALPADGRRRVPACPDWTVADLVAHLSGLAVVYGGEGPPSGVDRQTWLDGLVAERRGLPVHQLVDEWAAAAPAMEQRIADQPDRLWPLVYDVIAHEHDLRGALDRPGERDGAAVHVGLELGLRITGRDLRARGLPGVRVAVGPSSFVTGTLPTGLTLTSATSFEAFRLLGSRRCRSELAAATTDGDLDRFLPGLVHMALPAEPLGE